MRQCLNVYNVTAAVDGTAAGVEVWEKSVGKIVSFMTHCHILLITFVLLIKLVFPHHLDK